MSAHFWEALSVILFILIFFKPIKQALLGFLDKYIGEISERVQEAEELRKNAEKIFHHYQKAHREFVQKSQLISQSSKENIKKISLDAKKRLESQISIQKELHKERIRLYEIETLNTLRKNALLKAFITVQQHLEKHVHKPTEAQINKSISLIKQNHQFFQ